MLIIYNTSLKIIKTFIIYILLIYSFKLRVLRVLFLSIRALKTL